MVQTYKGSGRGNNGLIEVTVTLKDDVIEKVSVDSVNESPGIADYAIEVTPELIVENQSYSFDAVTGATVTASGIKKATKNALSKAEVDLDQYDKQLDLIPVEEEPKIENKFVDPAEINWDKEYDVVVIGAGIAGMAAAIEAKEKGSSVLVVEYAPSYLHSNSTLCGGYYYTGASSLHEEAGIEDSREEWKKYLQAVGAGFEDPDMVDTYIEHAPEDMEWLMDLGVKFTTEGIIQMGDEKNQAHITKPVGRSLVCEEQAGYGLTMPVNKYAEKIGVDFVYQTTAQKLITNKEGHVAGVITNRGNVRARQGVVVASAGFTRNIEWLKDFKPEMANTASYGSVRQQGDGIRMGMDVGADVGTMWMAIADSLGTQTADTVSVGIWIYMWDDPYYYVNSNGERFMDEGMYYEHAAKEIARQDGGYCWTIWDQRTVDNNRQNISAPAPSPGCEREIEDGYWKRADTIEELADLIDVPVKNLVKTHERYNTMMREKGEDKDFGREIGLYDMPEGPYYAAKTVSTSPDTAGGLKINKKAQVQDLWGNPIPNLYAAGATTAGWRGAIYPGCGHAITNAVVFGRIAGQEVAGL